MIQFIKDWVANKITTAKSNAVVKFWQVLPACVFMLVIFLLAVAIHFWSK